MAKPLSVVEEAFLHRWKSIDFTGWNEAAVREGFIIDLLHTLGYRKGTTYDLEFEKPLKLTAPYHRVGRKKVAIDYAPAVRKRHFWIVEAKPGTPRSLAFDDLLQVHLYAVHPEVQARLVVLTNGWQVRVYDALTMASFDDALLVVDQADPEQSFGELRDMLGAQTMLKYQRDRLVSIARDTFASEVDVDALRSFRQEMTNLLTAQEATVQQNAQELWVAAWKDGLEKEKRELKDVALSVLFVRMDLPEDSRSVSPDEFVRRVVESPHEQRTALVEELVLKYYGRPHNVFRVLALRAMVNLLELGIEPTAGRFFKSVRATVEGMARTNISYGESNALTNSLCHLDNAAMRTAYKLCSRLGGDYLTGLNSERLAAMTPRERAAERPTVEDLVVPTVAHLQEVLWRRYCSKSPAEEVWSGIWHLKSIEDDLGKTPPSALTTMNLLSGAWEYVGLSHDHLRVGTWNVLRRADERVRSMLPSDLVSFTAQTHREVIEATPQGRPPPEGWSPSEEPELEMLLSKVFGLRTVSALARFLGRPLG